MTRYLSSNQEHATKGATALLGNHTLKRISAGAYQPVRMHSACWQSNGNLHFQITSFIEDYKSYNQA